MKTLHETAEIRRNPSPARRPGEGNGRAWRGDTPSTPALRQAALRFKLRRLEVAVELRTIAGHEGTPVPIRGVGHADDAPRMEDRYEDAERWDGLS